MYVLSAFFWSWFVGWWGSWFVCWWWSWLISWWWSWFVSRSGMGMIRLGFVLRISGFALVFDICDITMFVSMVGNDLDSAIWQCNSVLPAYFVSVTRFAVTVI